MTFNTEEVESLNNTENHCHGKTSTKISPRPSPSKYHSRQEPVREYRKRFFKQLCYVIFGAMGHFCLGTVLTWPSPGISGMKLDNSTLVGTEISLNIPEMDMTGSLVSLGSLFGAFGSGLILNVIGRRRTLQLNFLPYSIGWIMMGLAPSPPVLLLGRFLLGIGVGSATVAGTTYIMEIADAKFRGTMSLVPTVCVISGSQYTLGLGTFLPWQYLPFAALLPACLLLATSFALPESPSHLIIRGRRQDASGILKQLRGKYVDVEDEIDDLERRNQSPSNHRASGCLALLKPRILIRVAVVVMTFLFQQLSGTYVLIVQTGRVLEAAGTMFRPATAASMVVCMRIGGCLTGFCLIDRIGRKCCLAISHAVNSTAFVVLGTFVYIRSTSPDATVSLEWVPMLCIAMSLFSADLGLHPVPYTLAIEYFPTHVRGQAASVCMSLGTVFAFVFLQLYSPMQDLLTQAGLYWFYAASSAAATLFVMTILKETKARPMG